MPRRRSPGGAVAHDYVGGLGEEIATLHVAAKAKAASGEKVMGLSDEAVSLLRLLSDLKERDHRLADADDLLREDRAHVRELEEVLGSRVGVRARVDQDARAAQGRQEDGDRGPVDVRQ